MVTTAGIDTWSLGWYVREDSPADRAMTALAVGNAGRYRRLPERVADHVVLYDRAHRLVMAEGHPDPQGLCSVQPDRLVAVQEAIADGLEDQGVRVDRGANRFDRSGSPGFAGVRRLDLAVDLHRSRGVGRAILNGVAACEPPGSLSSLVHRSRTGRSIETVYWQGKSGKMARVYDKGLESGSHAPGERVRFEDQRRFRIGHRPLAEDVQSAFAATLFVNRFAPLRAATKGMVVTSHAGFADRIKVLVDEGAITPAQAAKVTGLAFLYDQGVEVGSRTTRWRNRRQLQEFGFVLGDGVLEDVEVDLGAEFEEIVGSEVWERQSGAVSGS